MAEAVKVAPQTLIMRDNGERRN